MGERELVRVVRPVAGDLRLSRVAQLYVEELRGRVSVRHVQVVRGVLDAWIGAVGDLASSEVDEALGIAYRADAVRRGLAVRTANNHVQTLERALRWARRAGHIERNGLAEVEKLPERERDKKKKRRALTDEELVRFVETAREDDRKAMEAGRRKVPQTALWLVLLGTGGRRKETLGVRWRHFNFEPDGLPEELEGAATVRFVDTKNGKERVVPVAPDVAAEVRALREVHRELLGREPRAGDHVFLSPQGRPFVGESQGNTLRLFYRVLERAGIERKVDGRSIDLHACRMTSNARYQRANVETGTRQKFLGHSDPKLTENMYGDVGEAESFAALQQLVERELRRLGATDDEIEEALRAISSGSDSSAVARLMDWLMVTGGEHPGSSDDQISNLRVTGSSPVGRATLAPRRTAKRRPRPTSRRSSSGKDLRLR